MLLISLVQIAAAAYTLYHIVVLLIYRLFFHPLAHFPGPKLAAITPWYEGYYDLYLGGQYTFKLVRLHEEYGPIEIYVGGGSGRKRDKWYWSMKAFGLPTATITTISHDKHRQRRGALNPYFSMASVQRLQPVIQRRCDDLLARIREFMDNSEILRIDHAFAALSNADMIMEFSFALSDHRLAAKDFAPEIHIILKKIAQNSWLLKHAHLLVDVAAYLPDWAAVKLMPGVAVVVSTIRKFENHIIKIKASPKGTYDLAAYPTLFHEILHSKLPESDKINKRVAEEAVAIVGAGTNTVAWALTVAVFHLLTNPVLLRTLKAELLTIFLEHNSPMPTLAILQKLPYLTAVIQESLRLSYGASSRLARLSPDHSVVFAPSDYPTTMGSYSENESTPSLPNKDRPSLPKRSRPFSPTTLAISNSRRSWVIPPKTPMSMTALPLHHHESIFHDSHRFNPDRWLEAASSGENLDRYLVSFSKGTRNCAGINLAYAELYLGLSGIFSQFGGRYEMGDALEVRNQLDKGVLQLYEVDHSDIELAMDAFAPLTKPGSKGVRLRVSQ